MARGWESKAVESQIESAETHQHAPRITKEELLKQREIESIELSRTRVLHDMEAAKNPRHREMLLLALHHLDEKLKTLG